MPPLHRLRVILVCMPIVPFNTLPASARVWIFSSEQPLTGSRADRLLDEVDQYLSQWHAHGHPLTCGRAWRDDRFLAIGVDQSNAYASGCSIDGLYRALQAVQPAIGSTIVSGGQVHYRDADGAIRSASRDEFTALAAGGTVTVGTPVFDTTVATAGEWRERFETLVGRAWHKALLA
jgi:hypothetical protein